MSNLVSVKNLSELHLRGGIKLDWVKEDGSVKELRLRDNNGGRVVIRAGDYGSTIKVMIPKPFDEEDRWHLSGDLAGLTKVSEYFDSEYDAKDKLREFTSKVREECNLTIEKVKVQIDESGQIVEAKDAHPVAEEEIAF